MKQTYYENWFDLVKKAQEPLQNLNELNIKTLQGFSYLQPEDLTNFKNPEEFLEKSLHLTIENGHKTINYLKQSFQVLEGAISTLATDVKNKAGR